jgi:hypothetical protein
MPIRKKGDAILKKSSLKLLSQSQPNANLGTFWLIIKQFWPFEEISIFSNGGHLGWRAWLSDITFIVFNATFSNISAISWCPVLVVEEAGENHRPWASNW